MVRIFNEELNKLIKEDKKSLAKGIGSFAKTAAKDVASGVASQAFGGGITNKEDVKDAAVNMAKQIAMEKGSELGEKALELAASKVASEAGKAAIKDIPLADIGYAVYDLATSGDDGTWKSKLKNWGRAGGELAGGWGAGVAAGALATPETLGAAAVPAFIAGKMAGGAAGGFFGEKAGELLGSIMDKFTGGDKAGAVKDLTGILLAGGPATYMLQNAVKDFFTKDKEADSDDFDALTNAAKKQLPKSYYSQIDKAQDAAEEYEEDTEDGEDEDDF